MKHQWELHFRYPHGIDNITGKIKVTGGTITGYQYGIFNSTGTIEVTSGTINATGPNGEGIYNYRAGTIEIVGGTITGNYYGICNNDAGTIEITGGTITGTKNSGVYNYKGTITLGENEGNIPNPEKPEIIGGTYGIKNSSGTFNFYDGKITGETSAISGAVTSIPEGYKIRYEEDLTIAILEKEGDFESSILVEGIYYNSLETAIDTISNKTDKTGMIHICANLSLGSQITITEGANITIALEGHSITFNNVETGIINNGTLAIVDFENVEEGNTSITSTIKNENGTVIENNGSLAVGQIGNANNNSPRIEGTQAVSGNEAAINSGKLVNTASSASMMAYRRSASRLNIDKNTLLKEGEIKSKPITWTKDNVSTTVEMDVIPMLNLYSEIDKTYIDFELKGEVTRANEASSSTETQVEMGDVITYKVAITNTLQNPLKNIDIKGLVPVGLELLNILNNGEASETGITWNIEELGVGETIEFELFSGEVEYSDDIETINNKVTILDQESNDLEYEYKRETEVQSSIEKTTEQKVITSKDIKLYYEIEYNASIQNFKGTAEVTIVDTLPYPINKDESEIAGGEYDEETKTITWVETIEDIDTFESKSAKQIAITKRINLKYNYGDINETTGSMENVVESTIELQAEGEQNPEEYLTEDARGGEETSIEIPAQVIIHHYIYDENVVGAGLAPTELTKLIPDETIDGIIGQEYTTAKSANIPANYRCVNEEPEGHAGKMTEEPIEVNYYYELIQPTVENDITVGAHCNVPTEVETPVLTKEDGEITYNITYNARIENYKGKAVVKVVDTLPAGIDLDKSDIKEGRYDPEAHTITWEETIENIDTFANGAYTKQIVKQIKIVYEGQNVTQDLTNSVTGTVITYYPENHPDVGATIGRPQDRIYIEKQATDEAVVKQEYKVNFKVIKVWEDNENAEGKRPESVTIKIRVMPNNRVLTKVLNEENNWTYEEQGLPKYSLITGEKVQYIVTEEETVEGDLRDYEEAEVETIENQTEEVTNNTVTVINRYKLEEVDLGTVITKATGTGAMTDKGSKISYTINMTAEIPDYTGSGKVIIVDTLPYKIDIAKSNIAGGIYDDEKQTITWKEALDINTEEAGESYKVNITKNIIVVYKDIDLAQESMINSIKGRIELYDIQVKDEETSGAETIINVKGKVIVKYLEKSTGKELAEKYEIVDKIGKSYNTEPKEIADYECIETTNNETGRVLETDQEVIYYYKKTSEIDTSVIVKYQDTEGNKIAEDVVIEGHIGEAYKAEQKEIENYRFVEVKGQEEGNMTRDQIEVIYVYEKIPAKVIVRYLEMVPDVGAIIDGTQNDENVVGADDNAREVEILEPKEIEGYVGDNYEVSREVIPNYKAAAPEPENARGKMTEEPIEVKYYYEKLPSGIITVKYIEIDTEEEITYKEEMEDGKIEEKTYGYEIKGTSGEKYETEAKEIPYYKLVKMTGNTKGELKEVGDTVIYYYKKLDFNISLEKTISNITLNGKAVRISNKQLVKVEIPSKNIETSELIVNYVIKVENKGELGGKATVIEEIPSEYEIVNKGNYWKTKADGTLETEVELGVGESKELEISLKWVNSEKNLGSKANIARIGKTENEAGYEDTNEENNISTATVVVGIKTGVMVSIIITILIIGSLGIAGYMITITVRKMGKGPDIKKIKFFNK